ncbi:MAG: hypothetical protein LBV26_03760, partial [Bacteroidales bacterium]|nr:hypothetical protein [Bacteroidales bacterium]
WPVTVSAPAQQSGKKLSSAAMQQTPKRSDSCLLHCSKPQNGQIPVCCNAAEHKMARFLFAATQQSTKWPDFCLLQCSRAQNGQIPVCCNAAERI